jgi:hypothetical protein
VPDVDHGELFRPEGIKDGRRIGFGIGIVALAPYAGVVEGLLVVDKHEHWFCHSGSLITANLSA